MKKFFIIWGITLIFSLGYYRYDRFPLERSFIHAVHLIQQRDYLKARDEIDRIIQHYPEYTPAYVNRWYLYLKEGNRKAAREEYRRMYGLHLKDGEEHTIRTLFYQWMNRPDADIQFYDHFTTTRYAVSILRLS